MKLRKVNVFDGIDDDDILEILNDALADDDPQVFTIALSHLIEKKGVAQVAKLTGLNRENLYKTVNGQSQPTWSSIHKILHALKLTPQLRLIT